MSLEKNISFSSDARKQLLEGVRKVAAAVGSTLGAKGKNVIIGSQQFQTHHSTKDGVTVARSIFLEDAIENIGAAMIKEASQKTADVCGDGTTSTAVLVHAIAVEGMKAIELGAAAMDVKRGIEKGAKAAIEHLKTLSKPAKENKTLRFIATISANNDSGIGHLIADTFSKIGMEGSISVEDSKGSETTVRILDGVEFNSGFMSPYFMNNDKTGTCDFDNPYILLYERKIFELSEILSLLEATQRDNRPLFIICEGIDEASLQTLIVNKLQGRVRVCAVYSPGYGDASREEMEDLAVLTGGTFVTEQKGFKLSEVPLSVLGQCKKTIVGKDKTTIIGNTQNKEAIATRIEELKAKLENTKAKYEQDKIKSRLAKLQNGVAVLYVGGYTETEIKEKKDRIDDALCATRAALEEGYVAGGGVTYIKCANAIKDLKGDNEDETTGINILRKALQAPLIQMLANADIKDLSTITKVNESEYGMGLNLKTDKFEDLFKAGVIDPTKVARVAIENASSIAGNLLTTECVLSDINKK